MIPPARWRRWLLSCAPALALSAWGHPGLLLPALLLWTALGAALLSRQPLSPQKRPMLHRLFFAESFACCWMSGAAAAARCLPPLRRLPLMIGAACLGAVACERFLAFSLPRWLTRSSGILLLAVWAFFSFSYRW